MALWQKVICAQVLKWENRKGNFQNKMRNLVKKTHKDCHVESQIYMKVYFFGDNRE